MFMKSILHRYLSRSAAVIALWLLTALHAASAQTVSVSISPTYVVVQLGEQLTFTVTGNTDVTWQVDNANGGNSTAGTISTTGVYIAPSAMHNIASETVTAVSQAAPRQSPLAVITLVTQPAAGSPCYGRTT